MRLLRDATKTRRFPIRTAALVVLLACRISLGQESPASSSNDTDIPDTYYDAVSDGDANDTIAEFPPDAVFGGEDGSSIPRPPSSPYISNGGHDTSHNPEVEVNPVLDQVLELKIDDITTTECDRKTREGDTISMRYTGWLQDGTQFDSNNETGKDPFTFQLGSGHVIEGWEKGLLEMCPGDERNLSIPAYMAYGSEGVGPIPPEAPLFFFTHLLSIDEYAPEPATPSSMPSATLAQEPGVPSGSPVDQQVPTNIANVGTPEASNAPAQMPDEPQPSSPATEHVGPPQMPSDAAPTQLPANYDHSTDLNTGFEPGQQEYEDDVGAYAATGECNLLGPFALFVQAGLGILALASLVWKRYREKPRRPVRVWFFDASKQVVGTVLLHVANLTMSTFFSEKVNITNSAAHRPSTYEGETPNPCSYYFINILVDTTVGIVFLYIALKVLHQLAKATPLARPTESIRSGNYGQPPKITWWLKQCIIYFIGLFFMKLCVWVLFEMLPWLAWVGDWALRWTEGRETLQIGFVMFVFPLVMNAIQYYVIDSFIKDPTGGEHEPIASQERGDDESREPLHDPDRFDDTDLLHESSSEDGKEPLGRTKRVTVHPSTKTD